MLPKTLEKEIRLFQNSPLSNKVFIVVSSNDKDADISEAAQIISDSLSENENLGLSAPNVDIGFLLSYYRYFPNLWDDNTADKVKNILNEKEISNRIKSAVGNLYSPFAIFGNDFIMADPLGLLFIFTEKLKSFDFSGDLDINDGMISSKKLNQTLLVFNYPKNFLDLSNAKQMKLAFEEIKKELPENINAFYMGAPRYTSENDEMIRGDVWRIFIVSSLLMIIMFALLLRDKKALLIYLVPPIVIIMSAVITALIFKGISAITIGFGSVLMGLCVDYILYMYFALKSSSEKEKYETAKKMFKPIMASAATSIITFLLLLFSGIEVFDQVAIFCASGLLIAVFIALFIAPHIFTAGKSETQKSDIKQNADNTKLYRLSKKTAILFLIIIFIGTFAAFKHIKINTSLESLNASSKSLKADRKVFDEMTGAGLGESKMLFVFGNSLDETLIKNEKLSAQNPKYLKLAGLFPSMQTKQKHIEDWKKFWNANINLIKNVSSKTLKQYDINPLIFDDFYNFLKTGQSASDNDFNLDSIFNPI
ncbi:MAG: MMPL family transporter, partial [Elusimicrobiota bacterium]|nr:MMPL family transporter [Elusimicrobiota bacterium]